MFLHRRVPREELYPGRVPRQEIHPILNIKKIHSALDNKNAKEYEK